MGVVYRARDLKLNRDVAIKVLLPEVAGDADRLARFRREAQLLATLNHPHIAQIYGFEDADGIAALVLELVEGPTLADRIAQGPIRLDEALPIATQIADALDAAHERGIVHRDLKPANIKVRPDGTVKVLDFGLAKVLGPDGSEGSVAESPTITSPAMTMRGTILGTAAYMSPEQARGQLVDKRADIWAFGCVLYEMLTGRAAFARSTMTDTLAAVVDQQPDWSALPAATPHLTARLLRRCLEKDVRRRLRDVADAKVDLEDGGNRSPLEQVDRATRVRTRAAIAASWAVTAMAVSALLWTTSRREVAPVLEPVRFTIDLRRGEDLPLDAGLPRPFAITRDGRSIAYVARRPSGNRIYLRGPQDVEPRPITGTEGGNGPFFAPDGQWLGFASGGFLRKVPILGGTPQNIARVSGLLGATWADDGSIVFHRWQDGLFSVPADGGEPKPLTQLDRQGGDVSHQSPFALPGSRSLVFSTTRLGQPPAIELVDLSTGARTRLFEGGDPYYLSSGHLVFTRAAKLHAVPFDLGRLTPTGSPVSLSREITVEVVQNRGSVAASLGGTLAYIPAVTRTSRLAFVDASGGVRPVVEGEFRFDHPRLSPDGARLVVSVESEAGGNELWVYDLARNTRVRLSVTGLPSRPIWSGDGKNIVFQSGGSLHTVPADDSRPPETLLAPDSPGPIFPLGWSRDGRTLVYSWPRPETNRDVFTFAPGGAPKPFLVTPMDERSAMLSPDGRWMVYSALEAGREEEVYVQRYPGPGERIVASVGGGREPVWSPSGDEIFYRSSDGQRMLAVKVRTEPTLTIGSPRTVFQEAFRTGLFRPNYDVHPKTREFLILVVDESVVPRLTVALNETSSLGQR